MAACPICKDSAAVSFVRRHSSYRVLRCAVCQLQFSDPMTDPGSGFYQHCSCYESRSHRDLRELSSRDWRYRTFLETCAPAGSRSLLDVGCGDGRFLAVAQTAGYDVHGLDIDARAVQLANAARGLKDVRTGSWEMIEDTAGWDSFDVVTAFDVIEHLSSPAVLVSTVFRLLKPDGILFVTVPRLDRYPRLFDPEVDVPPHHLTLWTTRALTALLGGAGFEDIRIVEKQLMAEDLRQHATWRLRRLLWNLRRHQTNETHAGPASVDDGKPMPMKTPALRLVARSIASVPATAAVWVLRCAGTTRGQALACLGRKPS